LNCFYIEWNLDNVTKSVIIYVLVYKELQRVNYLDAKYKFYMGNEIVSKSNAY